MNELEDFQKLKQKLDTFAEIMGLRSEAISVNDQIILEVTKLKNNSIFEIVSFLKKDR